jgi:hypothetical protein
MCGTLTPSEAAVKIIDCRIIVAIVALLLAVCSIACAGTKPQVTRADGVFMGTGISFRIQWQSAEPIARALISMGSERKSVEVDFRDNRRNASGYSGEATALVPLSGLGAASAFTVQIEDELRQKSDVLNGVVTGNRPAITPGVQPDDGWGQQNLTRPGAGAPGSMQQQGVYPPPMGQGMMPQQPGMIMPQQPGMMQQQPGMMQQQPGMMQQQPVMPQQQPGMVMQPQPLMPMDPGMMPPPPMPPPPM